MRVGIVGGGITGLSLTHFLARAGVESVTYEASAQPGGVISSDDVAGKVVERGPQRMRLSPSVRDVVTDLGLEAELLEVPEDLPLYVYCDGRLRRVPFSVSEFLATDLLSWRGKLRLFAEPLTDAGRPEETVADLFTRKFGREAYENLVGPLFGGIYGSDPAQMPVEYSLSALLRVESEQGSLLTTALQRLRGDSERPPAVSFADGMQRFPRALYESHADRVHLETPVTAIRPDGDGYLLETDSGVDRVDEVVVTVPASVAADLLTEVDESAAALADLRYNPLAMVYVESDFDGEGMGYQVRHDEPFDTLGVSWNASMFDRDGVFTCFLGGMNDPDLVREDPEKLGDVATREFEEILGAPAEVVDVQRLEDGFPAHDHSWQALDRVDLPDDVHLMTNYTARMGVPSRVRQAKETADRFAAE
ncbi:protoporphyrinogen oxidase [Haloarculaceae archaeon H-GB1-1]|nr:protoporphyrinogen oxidase [Haloarculaceae archaeon H-GB1-1]